MLVAATDPAPLAVAAEEAGVARGGGEERRILLGPDAADGHDRAAVGFGAGDEVGRELDVVGDEHDVLGPRQPVGQHLLPRADGRDGVGAERQRRLHQPVAGTHDAGHVTPLEGVAVRRVHDARAVATRHAART